MATFVLRLKAPRPTFAQDMSDEEREIMGRHAAHWQPFVESGQMVVFGPILDDTGSWGIAVVEADDEDEVRELISEHAARTGSLVARNVLASWDRAARERFVKVMPRDYKRVLQAEAKARAEQREPDFAELVGAN